MLEVIIGHTHTTKRNPMSRFLGYILWNLWKGTGVVFVPGDLSYLRDTFLPDPYSRTDQGDARGATLIKEVKSSLPKEGVLGSFS